MKKEETIELLSKYAKENDELNKKLNKLKESILNETTVHCKSCPSRMCCNEEYCVIWRIEQLGANENR